MKIDELVVVIAFFVHLGVALHVIVRTPPLTDEVLYHNPAVSLVRHGHFGSTVMEARGSQLLGIDRVTYYALPGHPLTSAPLIALFGFNLVVLRLKSLALMLAAASLVFKLVKSCLPRPYPGLTLALLLVDRSWIEAATVARPDAQCFFFGLLGSYLFATGLAREQRWRSLAGGFLVAAAGITHVNGVIFGVLCLVLALRDLKRDPRHLLWPSRWFAVLGILPVVVGYWLFTRAYPDFFKGQMGWNATALDRLYAWKHPFEALGRELNRWVNHPNQGGRVAALAYDAISTLGLGALLVVLLSRRRGPFERLRALLLTYTAVAIFCFCFVNNIDAAYYFFYRRVVLDVALGAALALAWEQRLWLWRLAAGAAAFGVAGFNLSKDAAHVKHTRDDFQRNARLIRVLEANYRPGDTVLGLLEFAPYFDFGPNFLVDANFGFYSDNRPRLAIFFRNRGELSKTAEEAVSAGVSGGLCSEKSRAAYEKYATFSGPYVAGMLARDKAPICAYVADLAQGAELVYVDAHYDVVVFAPGRAR